MTRENLSAHQNDNAELTALREAHAALILEMEALRSERDSERRHLLKLTAQLDALIRSSSEVRYTVNADWSELDQLQGGGFIPDNSQSNKDWIDDYIPAEHRELVEAEITRATTARDTYNIEHLVNKVDGSKGWALSRAVPLFDENGAIECWIGAASDITARKMSEESLQILNSELSHRMKNTITIVQAIVGQTLRGASSIAAAREVIDGRLQALAKAQDILISTKFTEADAKEIAEAAVIAHQGPERRIDIVGLSYRLTPQQALGLSLSIHELATNAVKYGALSQDKGKIVISWSETDDFFDFQWTESGGPLVKAPEKRSFGSVLIERVAAEYFGGEGKLDFRPEGLCFTLRARKQFKA